MPFSDYLTGVAWAPTIPDWALLNGRIYITDGINPNLVLDGHEENTRIQGAFPPTVAPAAVNTGAGGALTAGEQYQYAHIRVVRLGSVIIRSDYMLAAALVSDGGNATITFADEYEYPPAAGAGWTVSHWLYRSIGDATTVLYWVADLTDATGASPYVDTLGDVDLQDDATRMAESIVTTISRQNAFIWPMRYVREWRKRLVFAGTHPYTLGSLSVAAGSVVASGSTSIVTINAPGVVRESDFGAIIQINGEPHLFTIIWVDVVNNSYTLSSPCLFSHDSVDYAVYREYNTLYICHLVGGNMEAYVHPDNYLNGDERSGNRITGLGSNARTCYVFFRNSVARLDESFKPSGDGVFSLQPLPGMPGCVSHATIGDRLASTIFWYAGEEGVWQISEGTAARKVSGVLDSLFRDQVDHSYDEYCHGVFDPIRQMYHLWLFENGSVAASGLRVPQLMLTYDLQRNSWYIGELAASISSVVTLNGVHTPVIGIPGAVAKLEGNQAYDGYEYRGKFAAGDTINGTEIILPSETLPTDGAGLAGIPLHVCKYDSNNDLVSIQRRIIQDNTSDTITLWAEFSTAPVVGDEWVVGAIRWHVELEDVNLLPNWSKEKTVVAEIDVLADPSAEAEVSRMTVTATGERTQDDAVVRQTQDMHNREIFAFEGSTYAIHARSAKVRIEGSTTKEVVVKALEVTQGQPQSKE